MIFSYNIRRKSSCLLNAAAHRSCHGRAIPLEITKTARSFFVWQGQQIHKITTTPCFTRGFFSSLYREKHVHSIRTWRKFVQPYLYRCRKLNTFIPKVKVIKKPDYGPLWSTWKKFQLLELYSKIPLDKTQSIVYHNRKHCNVCFTNSKKKILLRGRRGVLIMTYVKNYIMCCCCSS